MSIGSKITISGRFSKDFRLFFRGWFTLKFTYIYFRTIARLILFTYCTLHISFQNLLRRASVAQNIVNQHIEGLNKKRLDHKVDKPVLFK